MSEIDPQTVKQLREETGLGMMDCKTALKESGGDLNQAKEILRQKGMKSADKKQSRVTTEGVIESYIHNGGKLGALIELNCESDFVAMRPEFQELAKNIAMQVAASSNVQYVSFDDIPDYVIETEKQVQYGRDDVASKPEHIQEKIVTGRVEKEFKELTLLDQAYIKDQDKTVSDVIKEEIAKLGENIQVRRFQKFVLGE